MPAIKVYYDSISMPGRACRWAVLANNAEKDVECIPVSLAAGEQLTPEFLAMNPYHTVPTLKDESNGVILYESGAILQYLAERLDWSAGVTIPSAKTDMVARFKAINYLHWHHFRIRQGLVKAVYGRCDPLFGTADAVDNDGIKATIAAAKEWFPIFDKQLADNGGFIAGKYVTLVDLQAFCEFAYLLTNEYGLDIFNYNGYENIQAWLAKVREVNGFAVAHEPIKGFVAAAKGYAESSNCDNEGQTK